MNTNTTEEATTSPKVALVAFQALQSMLEKSIAEFQLRMDDEQKRFIDSAVAQGWKKFPFFSSYYGSHDELGEGDRNDLFLFHPSVDISQWNGVGFSHGHCVQGENNTEFEKWLSSLPEEHYIEL